jgi:uncharacterized integral membrane protein
MVTLVRFFLSILVTLTVILFSIANRENISVVFSPVHPPFEMPLFLLALGGGLLGFIVGGALVWLNASEQRKEKKKNYKKLKSLEKKLEDSENTENDKLPKNNLLLSK